MCLCLQGYENTESSVRKASVFCLVAVYMTLGEELRPHLSELNGSKVSAVVRKFQNNLNNNLQWTFWSRITKLCGFCFAPIRCQRRGCIAQAHWWLPPVSNASVHACFLVADETVEPVHKARPVAEGNQQRIHVKNHVTSVSRRPRMIVGTSILRIGNSFQRQTAVRDKDALSFTEMNRFRNKVRVSWISVWICSVSERNGISSARKRKKDWSNGGATVWERKPDGFIFLVNSNETHLQCSLLVLAYSSSNEWNSPCEVRGDHFPNGGTLWCDWSKRVWSALVLKKDDKNLPNDFIRNLPASSGSLHHIRLLEPFLFSSTNPTDSFPRMT